MLKVQFPALFLAASLTGCAVVKTYDASDSDNLDGLVYFLPNIYAKLVYTRTKVPSENIKATKAALEKAEAELKAANSHHAVIKAATELAKKEFEAAIDGTTAQAELKKKYESLQASLVVASENKKKKTEARDKAKLNAEASAATKVGIKFKDAITVTLLPATPDTRKPLLAKLEHKWNRSDDLKITTTSSGLLQSANLSSEDKTGEILVTLAKLVVAGFKVSSVPLSPSTTDTGKQSDSTERDDKLCLVRGSKYIKGIEKEAFTHEKVFDPSDPVQVVSVNQWLCNVGAPFELKINESHEEDVALLFSTEEALKENYNQMIETIKNNRLKRDEEFLKNKDPEAGLLYRRPLVYTVDLYKKIFYNDKNEPVSNMSDAELYRAFPTHSNQVSLPNRGTIGLVNMEAGAFVKTEHSVVFKDGMLVENKQVKPSEMLGFVKIPLDILNELIKLPTEILQLKFDVSSKEAELMKKEIEILKTREELKEVLEANQTQ